MPRTTSGSALTSSLCAAGAGVAWVIWAALNTSTHGGLDAGAAAVGERLALVGALLTVAWNVLLLPAAVDLGLQFHREAPDSTRAATILGIASLLFWAYGGATQRITPALEVSYIALSAVWWLGIGVRIRRERAWFGTFTIVLGGFAAWDALLTALSPVPTALYATAAPKLPLSIVWDFWLAWVLWDVWRRSPSRIMPPGRAPSRRA